MTIKSVAFIPARSGSKRIPNKNIKPLNGHPLMAYSIRAAIDSGIFNSVVCATDSEEYADIAKYYGAEVPFLRPRSISGDKSPDIDWVKLMLNQLADEGHDYDIFSILRPTSPFRLSETIKKAWNKFINEPDADSLRAVEKCKQHPGKMWSIEDNRMNPIMPFKIDETPWHSSQYTSLPEVYVQDASLEIAWTRIALEENTIAGENIMPFISSELEGFDINLLEDWVMAKYYLNEGLASLPIINDLKYDNQKTQG